MRNDAYAPRARLRPSPVLHSRALSCRLSPPAVLCAVALTASAAAGCGLLYTDASPRAAAPLPVARAAAPAAIAPLRYAAALLDPTFIAPGFTAGLQPVSFTRTVALRSNFQPPAVVAREDAPGPINEAQADETQADAPQPAKPALALPAVAIALPVPPSRPASLAAVEAKLGGTGRTRAAEPIAAAAPPSAPPDQPGFFDRMFGQALSRAPALAYASPEAGGLGSSRAPDRLTAVYDIAAHTVTLPDGTRLEAHSGLGAGKDNPQSVAQHMRGATPPAVYELTPREALFHGVAALRLTPVGGGNPYGRAGLLAHTYMLGAKGDSNGCVVFRDYRAFREAYDRGLVRRLVVVARGT